MDWILRRVGTVGIALAFAGTLLVLLGAVLDHWRLYPAGKRTVGEQTTEKGVTIPPHYVESPARVAEISLLPDGRWSASYNAVVAWGDTREEALANLEIQRKHCREWAKAYGSRCFD